MRRTLGVDPGSSATGWAVLEVEGSTVTLVAHGVIRPKGASRAARLADLDHRLAAVVAEGGAESAAVESAFTGRNPRSSLSLAECRGVVLSVVARGGLTVSSYTPAEVKSAVVGHGAAAKEQVGYMVQKILCLRDRPPRDASDAMAVALAHLRLQRWRERLDAAASTAP